VRFKGIDLRNDEQATAGVQRDRHRVERRYMERVARPFRNPLGTRDRRTIWRRWHLSQHASAGARTTGEREFHIATPCRRRRSAGQGLGQTPHQAARRDLECRECVRSPSLRRLTYITHRDYLNISQTTAGPAPISTVSKFLGQVRDHSDRAIWAVAEQGINPVVQLALTPWLLANLGREEFGVWTLAIAVVSVSQITSFGAGTAATRYVSADLGAGDRIRAVAAVRAALAIAIIGGLLVTLLAWLTAPLIATHLLLKLGDPRHTASILALCGAAAALQEIDNVYAGAMRGAERFDLCAKSEVPARIGIGVALAYLASTGANARTLVLSLIIMMALKAALKAMQVAVVLNSGACAIPSIARPPIQRILHFGLWQWLQSAGSAFFTAADQLLIGSLLGASALTRYSVCLQIAQYVHMLPSVMMQVIFPRLSSLGDSLDAKRGNDILRAATIAAVGTAILLAAPIIAFAQPVLSLWVGPAFAAENHWLLIILILVHVTLSFNVAAYYVLLGSGRAARSAAIVLAGGFAQCVFAVLAVPFGILTVACNRFTYALITAFLIKAARFKTHEP